MKPLEERQQREYEREEIIKKAVEAADRIILDGSDGSEAETNFLIYRNILSKDLED